MLIISVQTIKTVDETEMQKTTTTTTKKIKAERNKENKSYSERVRAK